MKCFGSTIWTRGRLGCDWGCGFVWGSGLGSGLGLGWDWGGVEVGVAHMDGLHCTSYIGTVPNPSPDPDQVACRTFLHV